MLYLTGHFDHSGFVQEKANNLVVDHMKQTADKDLKLIGNFHTMMSVQVYLNVMHIMLPSSDNPLR